MRRQTLVQVWLAIVVTAALALLFVVPAPRVGGYLLAIAIATGLFAIYTRMAWRRLAGYLRQLEDYAASLPSSEIELPESLPEEFGMLSSALQRTSQHVGSVIKKA